jgi:hypothetical protein
MMPLRRLLLLAACCAAAYAAPRKTNRDWASMSDKDWEKIEEEWETPEEKEEYEYKPPQKKGIDIEKLQKAKGKKLQSMIAESQQSAGPTMMFATLDYEGCCNKKQTEEIGTRWAGLLRGGGMDITTYVIEDDQVLFSSQTGLHAHEIRDYVTQQPECVAIDWNQQRHPGPAETDEWKAKDAVKKAAKEEANAKKKAEEEALKKAEAKKKKKKRKKKGGGGGAKDKDEV